MTKEFGEVLSSFVSQSELRKTEIAMQAHMHPSVLSQAIHGRRNLPIEHAVKVAYVLDVPLLELAEFLLLAQGYPEEIVHKAVQNAGQRTHKI